MSSIAKLAAISTFAAQAELSLWDLAMTAAGEIPEAEEPMLRIIEEFKASIELMSKEWVK